jgi:hypothetical protein
MARIWTLREDTTIADEAFRSPITWGEFPYDDRIVTAGPISYGHMSRFYSFSRRRPDSGLVMAEIRIWDEDKDPRQLHVFVTEGPLHPDGIYLSQYDGFKVMTDGKRTITQKTGVERHDMMSHPHFVGKAFITYQFMMRLRRKTDYKPAMLLVDAHDYLQNHPFALTEPEVLEDETLTT